MLFYEKLEVSVAKLNKANLKKTLYYLQRNGLRETWISVRERLTETDRYFFVPCSEAELEKQRRGRGERGKEGERGWEASGCLSSLDFFP